MVELGFRESKTKEAVAGVGEKVGRLKLNGQIRGYSPLSRVLELEALAVGVPGSWRFGSRCSRFRESVSTSPDSTWTTSPSEPVGRARRSRITGFAPLAKRSPQGLLQRSTEDGRGGAGGQRRNRPSAPGRVRSEPRSDRAGGPEVPYEFVSECANADCTFLVAIPLRDYETIRSDPKQFVLLPLHYTTEDEDSWPSETHTGPFATSRVRQATTSRSSIPAVDSLASANRFDDHRHESHARCEQPE